MLQLFSSLYWRKINLQQSYYSSKQQKSHMARTQLLYLIDAWLQECCCRQLDGQHKTKLTLLPLKNTEFKDDPCDESRNHPNLIPKIAKLVHHGSNKQSNQTGSGKRIIMWASTKESLNMLAKLIAEYHEPRMYNSRIFLSRQTNLKKSNSTLRRNKSNCLEQNYLLFRLVWNETRILNSYI